MHGLMRFKVTVFSEALWLLLIRRIWAHPLHSAIDPSLYNQ